jgi:4-hydroxybenzoate polyprenyltransferase
MLALLLLVWRRSGSGALFGIGILVTAAALVYQHAIVRPGDLSRVDAAFFQANGLVSVALAVLGIADVLVR